MPVVRLNAVAGTRAALQMKRAPRALQRHGNPLR
jgi:hypothetical protein